MLIKCYLRDFAYIVTSFANIPFYIPGFLLNCFLLEHRQDFILKGTRYILKPPP